MLLGVLPLATVAVATLLGYSKTIMLRLIRSLGRLSVRGYLIVAGFAVIAVLATYANMQNGQQTAATKQLRQRLTGQEHTTDVSLKTADNAPTSSPQTLGDSTTTSQGTPAPQSSAVAQARHQAGALVFTPANITLSLSHKLSGVTVTPSDGAHITAPVVTTTSSNALSLIAQKATATTAPSWQMQFSGQPAPGTYQLTLHASSDTTDYTGTVTVVVVL